MAEAGNQKPILVVGGAGYIGSIVTRELLSQGYEAVVLDDLSTGHLAALPEGSGLVKADIGDEQALRELFSRYSFEAVMHFAGKILARESMERPGLYFQNNVANAITLLNAMLEAGVKKLVFSSSAAVYAASDKPLTEDSSLVPSNPYGESKLMMERMLAWWGRLSGLRYASLRYFNAAGAAYGLGEDHHPESHLIPIALQAALGLREEMTIYGSNYPTPDGTCVRDYTHVLDLAQAHILALEHLEKGSIICNLGAGRGYSVREVLETVEKVTGGKLKIKEGPRRPGDPAVLVSSSALAQEKLGWRRRFETLEDIIATAWEWRQKHPRGYEA